MFSLLSSFKTLPKRVAEELFHSKTIIDVFRTLSNIYDKAVSERKNCIICLAGSKTHSEIGIMLKA